MWLDIYYCGGKLSARYKGKNSRLAQDGVLRSHRQVYQNIYDSSQQRRLHLRQYVVRSFYCGITYKSIDHCYRAHCIHTSGSNITIQPFRNCKITRLFKSHVKFNFLKYIYLFARTSTPKKLSQTALQISETASGTN